MKLEKNKLLDKFGKSIIFKENLSNIVGLILVGQLIFYLNQIA